MKSKLRLLAGLLLFAAAFTSCDKGGDEPEVSYTVTFNADGGTPAPQLQTVKAGEKATAPANPAKTGYVFLFWYLSGSSAAYNFATPVTGNITLQAKWEDAATTSSTSFTIRNTTDWNNAVNTIRAAGNNKSYTLAIEGNVSVPPTTGVDQAKPSTYTFGGGEKLSVTVNGSGTLTLSGQGFLICMAGKAGAKQKLIIDGTTLQGRTDNTVSLLRLDYANLELKAGKITGNTNNGGGGSGDGGGVCIKNGWLTMSGGEITNNTCGQKSYVANGGGVSITGGSCIMSGGTISGNTGNDGGGVYLYGDNFTMTGGAIKGNTSRSSSPYGGGVYYRRETSSAGSFTKTGGIICGSNAAETDRNKVIAYDGAAYTNHGAAVFYLLGFFVSDTYTKRRETTLDESNNITTDNNTGWGI
jgi:uncharacterized repeat protein (TIGR02543 family)